MNPFSHVDLRVNSFQAVLPFYEALLPALGFTRTFHSERWRVFAADGDLPEAAYFAITEDPGHRPDANLIGFWAENQEQVDRIAELVVRSGGKISDGPRLFPISPTYYAAYFEDPCGNKYEIVHRLN
ncbi:putative lactoylglutathione lyase [Hydrogenispora ethanolica]|jgi:predicted enzyme related to lactoylglutathione lyase|uniref:Putative lactoylglutathione lyase n=1 Tax=Hydrogenispora ethanolica TaxID=1082276 RepID=A0A4R1QUR7_HYDET|nr:VOC family protein [Hydrogenispora ethanolica]TCL57719.1 putative lactoylglutathione lyase [Hydrogenispora ethanolica]